MEVHTMLGQAAQSVAEHTAEVEATSLRVEGKNRKGVLYEEGADKTFFFRADNGALVGYRVKFGDNSIRATAIQLYIPKSVLELLGLTSL